jgi:hypothetical protein
MLKILRAYFTLGVIIGPLPNNIVDGTIIDAVPVMANFNWIVAQVNANASAGTLPNSGSIPTFVPSGSVGGTANAVTLAPTPVITSYAAGQRFSFPPASANTAATTVAISGLAPRNLLYADGTALSGNEMLSTGVYDIEDNGSNLVLMNSAQGSNITNWTPGITFGGGNTGITYTTQSGIAFKVGRICFFAFFVQLSNKGSSTGTMNITGLPFTINANWLGNNGGPCYATNVTFASGFLMINLVLNQKSLGLLNIISASNFAALTDTAFSNTSSLASSMFYAV